MPFQVLPKESMPICITRLSFSSIFMNYQIHEAQGYDLASQDDLRGWSNNINAMNWIWKGHPPQWQPNNPINFKQHRKVRSTMLSHWPLIWIIWGCALYEQSLTDARQWSKIPNIKETMPAKVKDVTWQSFGVSKDIACPLWAKMVWSSLEHLQDIYWMLNAGLKAAVSLMQDEGPTSLTSRWVPLKLHFSFTYE